MTEYLQWLSVYFEVLNKDALEAAVRFFVPIVTLTFSVITFYLKMRDRAGAVPAKLALAETSWDAASKFPVFFMSGNLVPFPFISSDLKTRTKSSSGWFTVTELRIWNAGGGVIFGPLIKRSTVLEILIPSKVGPYEIGGCLSNDPEMNLYVSSPLRSLTNASERLPIFFDFMPAQKGIIISIRHNSPNGELIRIRAFSELTQAPVWGTHFVFRKRVVDFMNGVSYILLVPSAALTAYMFYDGNFWQGFVAGLWTWSIIWSVYTQLKFTMAPEDLRWSSAGFQGVIGNRRKLDQE